MSSAARGGTAARPAARRAWRRPRLAALASALAVASCGAPDARSAPSGDPGTAPEREILVSAAASLTDAFADLASAFEAANPGARVLLNTGGSPALREQILEGAPADVFAPADPADLEALVEAGEVAGEPRTFARNGLVIAVPRGNPGRIAGLEDFADPDRLLGLCAEGVPCGDLARRVLDAAGVDPAPATEEPHVRALLTKVELGELDAGITYATDVTAAGDAVEAIPIPPELNVAAEYAVAALEGGPNPRDARSFVDFVLSDAGRAILARHGFRSP